MTNRNQSFCYPLAIQFALPPRYRGDQELPGTLDGLRAFIEKHDLLELPPFSVSTASNLTCSATRRPWARHFTSPATRC